MSSHPPTPSTPLEPARKLLVLAFVLAAGWYITWRAGTLNPQAPIFSALLFGVEVFGLVTTALHVFMCWRLTDRVAPPPAPDVTVDVFVPTYNESVDIVRKTLLAAIGMDHPHRTWLLDDGRREEMRELALSLGCEYLTRPNNEHAKAGNLNHALPHSRGEIIAIFDADHAPRQDFLTRTLGYFQDPKVAFVQTPQDFYNLDSYQHRWGSGKRRVVWTEQSLFFKVIQRGKDWWNAAFFCGSCALIRRKPLEEIGGFATGTVTEDLHTSLRIHARGHKSVYHAEPLAFGVAPESITPFLSQRLRWGQGAMHVWRKEGILTLKGLTLAQRLNYLGSVLTYFDGWLKGVMYVAPAVVLLTGLMPIGATATDFLLHFVPYMLLSLWMFEELARGYGRTWMMEQYNMARFATFALATLAWVLPPKTFKVTSKGMQHGEKLWQQTWPQIGVLALNTAAVVIGAALQWFNPLLPADAALASSFWAALNVAIALGVMRFSMTMQRNRRQQYRFPVSLPARLKMQGQSFIGTVDDLSDNGLRYYGKLPAGTQRGNALRCDLKLPSGEVSFPGEVRTLVADRQATSADDVRRIGIAIQPAPEMLHRIEQFLYGSDVQWVLNGYTDRVHTPMSMLLPGLIDGPVASPFGDVRWSGCSARLAGGGPVKWMLVSTASGAPGASGDEFVVSHDVLPEGKPMEFKVFRQQQTEHFWGEVSRVRVDGPGGTPARLISYRLVRVAQQQARTDQADATTVQPDHADTLTPLAD